MSRLNLLLIFEAGHLTGYHPEDSFHWMVPHNHSCAVTDQKDSHLGAVGPEVATPMKIPKRKANEDTQHEQDPQHEEDTQYPNHSMSMRKVFPKKRCGENSVPELDEEDITENIAEQGKYNESIDDPYWMHDNEDPDELSQILRDIAGHFRNVILKKTDEDAYTHITV